LDSQAAKGIRSHLGVLRADVGVTRDDRARVGRAFRHATLWDADATARLDRSPWSCSLLCGFGHGWKQSQWFSSTLCVGEFHLRTFPPLAPTLQGTRSSRSSAELRGKKSHPYAMFGASPQRSTEPTARAQIDSVLIVEDSEIESQVMIQMPGAVALGVHKHRGGCSVTIAVPTVE
jgi:hypothetical protein